MFVVVFYLYLLKQSHKYMIEDIPFMKMVIWCLCFLLCLMPTEAIVGTNLCNTLREMSKVRLESSEEMENDLRYL